MLEDRVVGGPDVVDAGLGVPRKNKKDDSDGTYAKPDDTRG